MSETKPIKTMVVGLGRIGWQHHLQEVVKKPAFELVAAVDTEPDRRKEAADAHGCATFDSIDKALAAGLAELAIICTRSIDHSRHSLAALEAGCHVFVDKPAALSVGEFDAMIAAAKKNNLVLTVHQSTRMLKGVRYAREIIDSGVLGEIFWIRFFGLSFYRRNDWQVVKEFGGGMLNNGGVHHIDCVLQMADAPIIDVWGDLKHTGVCAGDADDFTKAAIRCRNGRLLEVDLSYACAQGMGGWHLYGSCGSAHIYSGDDGVEFTASLKYFDPAKAPARELEGPVPAGRKYRIPDELPWVEKTVPAEPAKPFGDFYDNLHLAIRKGATPLVTPESVRQTIWVMDEVRKHSLWKY